MNTSIVRKIYISVPVLVTAGAFLFASFTMIAYAAGNSNLTQVINPGTLSVDIVDAGYTTVASPSVAMTAGTFSFSSQVTTGSLGTASEQIYVTNPDAADGGWTMSIAGSATTAVWDSTGTAAEFDFNDPTAAVADGGDTDVVGGQLTIDASGATLATGNCSACVTTNITKGSSASFSEGVTDSITLLTGAAASDDIGDWTLQGVSLSQTIPAEQAAEADYVINMVLSII